MRVRIDDEIRHLCRALTDEERRELRASLEAEGLRESLIVWSEENILLDGHHRYELCQELGITPRFKPAPDVVKDRPSALLWVHRTQVGRRNLGPEEMSYHRGIIYEAEKKAYGGDRKSSGQNDPLIGGRTAERVGAELGVSPKTIRRDAAFARAVDSIERNVSPEVAQSIRTGKSGLSKSKVTEIGAMDAASQQQAIEDAKKPRRNDNSGARLALADNMTPEQAYEKIAALQASGMSFESALKTVSLGRHSYQAIHRIMLLNDRDDLSERDQQLVRQAREEMNREYRVSGPAQKIAQVAHRIWGDNLRGQKHDQAEQRRIKQFEKAISVMAHGCISAKDIEVPHLSPVRAKELLDELNEAMRSLKAFMAKIKELSE